MFVKQFVIQYKIVNLSSKEEEFHYHGDVAAEIVQGNSNLELHYHDGNDWRKVSDSELQDLSKGAENPVL
jgi:hypothetical protein